MLIRDRALQIMVKNPKISIVIPVYNESARLRKSILRLKTFLDSLNYPTEVVMVIEKSSDDSEVVARKAIATDMRFLIISNAVHRGKGYAVKTGVLKSKGTYIFFMDVDLSTDLSAVKEFVYYFEVHPSTQVLIGSREHTDSKILIPQNILRRNMGRTFNKLIRIIAINDYKDTQCGFKAFRKPAAMKLFGLQSSDGFAFDVELLMLAKKMNYKTHILPVIWSNSEESKVGIVSGSLSMILDVCRIKWRVSRLIIPK